MRIKKIWKSAFLLTLIPGSLLSSVALISCGSKEKPAPKATWTDFKGAASDETVYKIVSNAKPSVWAGVTTGLDIHSFVPDEANKIIKVNIIHTIDASTKSNANFQIKFENKKYDVKNWTCSKKPVSDFTWDDFLAAVQAVTPDDFLAAAKKSPNYKTKFTWGGDTSQQTWQAGDKAEFDVYGGLVTVKPQIPDPAGVNLMHGNPTDKAAIDKTAATVTVVISKTNRAGLFDADPIKIVYQYSGSDFNISKGVFSKATQLQSRAKYLAVANAVIGDFVNDDDKTAGWNKFAKESWVDNLHTPDNTIAKTLQWGPTSSGWKVTLNDNEPEQPIGSGASGVRYYLQVWWISDATFQLSHPNDVHKFEITNNFIYLDSTHTNITTTPFNNSWVLKINQIK